MRGGISGALRQVRFTNKAFWRNPAAAFFTFAFPLMFLVIFSVLFGGGHVTVAGAQVTVNTFYVPAIAAFSVITACFTNIAMSLVFARDNGVLKRVHGSPMPAWSYVLGRVLHAAMIGLLLVSICVLFGVVFYGVSVPVGTLPAFLLTIIVGSAAFAALGIAIVAVIPNADAAPAVVNGAILPLLFISNVFIPLQDPPAWIDVVGGIFPVRPFADAMLGSFFAPASSGVYGQELLVVGLWGAVGLALGARFFSWAPRK